LRQAEQSYEEALLKDERIGTDLERVKTELNNAVTTVESLCSSALDKLREPAIIIGGNCRRQLQELKNNLDALKLPTSTSREFSKELAGSRQVRLRIRT